MVLLFYVGYESNDFQDLKVVIWKKEHVCMRYSEILKIYLCCLPLSVID